MSSAQSVLPLANPLLLQRWHVLHSLWRFRQIFPCARHLCCHRTSWRTRSTWNNNLKYDFILGSSNFVIFCGQILVVSKTLISNSVRAVFSKTDHISFSVVWTKARSLEKKTHIVRQLEKEQAPHVVVLPEWLGDVKRALHVWQTHLAWFGSGLVGSGLTRLYQSPWSSTDSER